MRRIDPSPYVIPCKYKVIYEGYCDEVTEVVEADDVFLQDDFMHFYKNDELVFAISKSRLICIKKIYENERA